MIAGMGAWFAMILMLAMGWRLILRALHPARPGWRLLMMLQAQAWVGRYLPAKAGLLIGKSVGSHALTMRSGLVASSVVIEQLAFLSLGALLTAVALLAQGNKIGVLHSSLDVELVVGVLVPLLCLGAALGLVLLNGLVSRTAQVRVAFAQRLKLLFTILLVYSIANALPGFGMYVLANDLGFFADVSLVQWIGVAAFVNIAGMLVVFAPAGLGARELVLGFCLIEHGTREEIIVFVAGFRMLTIVADLAFYGCWGKLWFAGVSGRGASPQKLE
jgi:hypothetical protein